MSFIDNLELLCNMDGNKITPTIIKLGISPGSLSRWRAGATINSDLLLKLAKHFGVSTDFILTGQDTIAKRLIYPDNPVAIDYDQELDVETKAMLQRYNALPEPLKAQCRTFVLATYSASNYIPDSEKKKLEDDDDIIITPNHGLKGEENVAG